MILQLLQAIRLNVNPFILALGFCCISHSSIGQASDGPKPISVKDHTEYWLKDHAVFLGIPAGKSPEEAFARKNEMVPFNRELIEIDGNGKMDFWFYFEVSSSLGNPYLSLPFLQLAAADLYKIENGSPVLIHKGGTLAKSEERYLVYPGELFDLQVQEGETNRYLLKLNRILYKTFSAKIISDKKLISTQHKNFLMEGMLLGIIFGVIIYHLLIYIKVREREYLLLSVYMFFLMLLLATISGTIYGIVTFTDPDWNYRLFNFISPITSIFSLWFSIVFLDITKEKYPRAKNIYWIFQMLFLFNIVFSILEIPTLERLTFYTSAPASIYLLYMGTVRLKDGFRPAGIYLASYIPASLAVIFLTLYTNGLLEYSWFVHNILLLGVVLQAIFFSLAIARKIRLLKDEKEDLLREEKRNLEEKVRSRTEDLNKSLIELKAAQSQLIQAEKMASLGELTAGIAHEIQNPLNFVNNFSELSEELIDELQEELQKGDIEEAKAISKNLKENLLKINHHGNRAGSIVRGMLEHSRKSDGKKELTDLNLLADECLRLSFHGLRAKDKSFQADFKTEFDPNIPKVKVVSQDIGRVLLNLINNAFYAATNQSQFSGPSFIPRVTVSTHSAPNGVEVSIMDNGIGIPDTIKEKIFQPFFTTKPTGSGTGLGLSLSYDIVKAHGGEIKIETQEGKGSTFIFFLPLS